MSTHAIAIQSKATKVEQIFDVLATVVLIVGTVGIISFVLSGLFGLSAEGGGFGALLIALAGAVGVAIYTALTWAGITLATVIAGYIAERLGTVDKAAGDDQPAGWYPDPEGSDQERYWDGSEWTEFLEPVEIPASPTEHRCRPGPRTAGTTCRRVLRGDYSVPPEPDHSPGRGGGYARDAQHPKGCSPWGSRW